MTTTLVSPAVWQIVSRHVAHALVALRDAEPFAGLDRGQWATLQFLLHSGCRGESPPTQARIAAFTGISVRSVRQHLAELRNSGILGDDHAFELGTSLAAFLVDFASSCPSGLVPATVAAQPAALAAPLATIAAPPAAVAASAPLIKNKEDLNFNSFCSSSLKGDPAPATVAGGAMTTERRLALDALAALFRRANPGLPLPRTCRASDVELVATCVAFDPQDPATLAAMHRDAIEGAFARSTPGRPPTPRFIWGGTHFFLEHVRVGRSIREATAVPTKPNKPASSGVRPADLPASFEWLSQHLAHASAALGAL